MFKCSAESMREIMNSIHDALFIHESESGKIVFVNQRVCELYNCTEEEALNISLGRLNLGTSPYSNAEGMDWIKKAENEGEQVFEWVARKISGETFWTEVALHCAEIEKKKYIIAVVRDISERKKIDAERQKTLAQMQAILDANTNAIAIINNDGFFLGGNKALFERWGKTQEELIGHSAREILPEHIYLSRLNIIKEVIRTKTSNTFTDEYNAKWFENTISPVVEIDGSVSMVAMSSFDITERKNTENAKAISEEKYRLISSITSDYMFSTMVDANGNLEVTWIAGAFEQITGYSVEEYKARGGWRSILHPDDVLKDMKDMAQLQENKMVITEIRTLKKSGEISWVKVYAHPVWDEKKNCLVGIYGAVQDISERKKTEINLSKSEERFRILVEQAADGIFLGDTVGNFIGVNTRASEITGYGKSELVKMNMSDLFSEEEKNKTPLRYDLLKKGQIVKNERVLTRKDGSLCYVEMHTKMMPDKTYQSIFRDITERKKSELALQESEEKYRLIFEYSPVGLLSFDKNGVIVACNDNFVKIIGSSREKLIGLNMLTLPDKDIVATVQKALNGSTGMYEGMYTSVTAKKTTPARCLFAPVSIGGNGNLGGVGIIEDITERKLIEDRIKKINQELELLVKERTTELENTNIDLKNEITERTKAEEYIKHQLAEREVLLKEIHHRVKNNMQIIISILNLQSSFIKNKKIVNILQDSQNRVKAMALIHEKLYQTKNFANINFSEYINNLLKYLFSSYQSPDQQIEYKINIEPIAIDIDTVISLGLVTNELVSNSFKYAFADKINCIIEISLKKHDEKNLVMAINDNGKGLPPEFDYKHTESLGLQLVCLLTEQIQGTLNVESSDKGTTFSIIFPVK